MTLSHYNHIQHKSFRPLASQSPWHDSHDNPKPLHRALGGPKSHDVTSSGRSLDAGVARIPNGEATHSRTGPRPPKTPTGHPRAPERMGTRDGLEKRARADISGADIVWLVAQSRTRWVDKLQKSHIFRPLASQSPCHDSQVAPNHLHRALGGPKSHGETLSIIFATVVAARILKLSSTHSQTHPRSSRAPQGDSVSPGQRQHQRASREGGRRGPLRPISREIFAI